MPAEKHRFRQRVNAEKKVTLMGDKSPKSNQKKATQKSTQATVASKQKQAAAAAKQAPAKKK